MEADKVRERISRKPKGYTSLPNRKKQRLARSTPNFGAVDSETESPQNLHRAVIRSHTRAAADQQHIAVKVFKRLNGFICAFRNVALSQDPRPCLCNQCGQKRRVAIANIACWRIDICCDQLASRH